MRSSFPRPAATGPMVARAFDALKLSEAVATGPMVARAFDALKLSEAVATGRTDLARATQYAQAFRGQVATPNGPPGLRGAQLSEAVATGPWSPGPSKALKLSEAVATGPGLAQALRP